MFLDFNTTNTQEQEFDEYFDNKRDLGKVLRNLCKLTGSTEVVGLLLPKL